MDGKTQMEREVFKDIFVTLLNGDALSVLRTMPSESVQCAITSPPYFGLRSYKTVPQIWDGDEVCCHVWGENLPFAKQDLRSAEKKRSQGAAVGGSITFNDVTTTGNSGNYCQCGAWKGELGLEPRFQDYIRHLLQIFGEVKRVLKKDGTCFVNLGDSYATHAGGKVADPMRASGLAGTKTQMEGRNASGLGQYKKGGTLPEKCLMNIPHRFFIGMTDELQMIQRNNINWWKRACMPSSATDRWTVDFESIGFFSKNAKYKFNQQLEPTLTFDKSNRNRDDSKRNNTPGKTRSGGLITNAYEMKNQRTTWDISFKPQTEEHYASYPTKLVERMILAGTDEGDTVLDVFAGTGTSLVAAKQRGRKAVGIELNPEYCRIIESRIERETGLPLLDGIAPSCGG